MKEIPNESVHVMCSCQTHTCGNFSDKQINSVSESLSASANYLLKLVGCDTKESPSSEEVKETPKNDACDRKSTTSVHADVSLKDAIDGLTSFDSKDVDTDAYSVKRQAYDMVRAKYPKIGDLLRDEKVRALKELKAVGFKYYTIQVTVFVKKDGLTRTVSSKAHHRLELPSKDYLESILRDTFKGILRPGAGAATGLSD